MNPHVTHLLDTNVMIRLLRGEGQDILTHLKRCIPGTIALSTISLAELSFGAQLSKRETESLRVQTLLQDFVVVPFGEQESWVYGHIRHKLQKKGTPIG